MTLINLISQIYFNVKTYGAKGDGTTDDSTAITSAITAAGSDGTVFFPAGTYITGTQTIVTGVHFMGAGPGVSTIKLKSATNADLFSANTSFIGLSTGYGLSNVGGVNNFSFRDLTLDGNKAGQTTGTSYPLRFYGYNYTIDNVEIRNGYVGGILCDWNGGDINTGPEVEARYRTVKIFENNGIGFQIGGPHDSVCADMHIMRNGTNGVHITPNARGLLWSNSHSWGTPQTANHYVPWLVEGNSCQFSSCVAEGSDATNLVILASDTSWTGGNIYGAGTTSVYGIQLGQVAGGTLYPGVINQSAGAATAITSTNNYIQTKITDCNTGAINEISTSKNTYFLRVQQTAGTAVASNGGYLGGDSTALLMVSGLTADGTHGKGGVFQLAGETSFTGFLIYDGAGNQLLTFNSYNGGLAIGSGRLFQGYSDSGLTVKKFQFDASTGNFVTSGNIATGQSASAATLASSGTIAVGNLGDTIVAPTANVTGVILAAGTTAGQYVAVINQSAFTVTFAASGTSHVADGTSDVIAANNCRLYKWNALNSLWYPAK